MKIDLFLQQNPVRVAVDGRYSLPNWYDSKGVLRSFACRTRQINTHQMLVDVPVTGKVDQSLPFYFSEFGRFDAVISDVARGSFLAQMKLSEAARTKLSKKLDWLGKHPKHDSRKDARIIPEIPHSTLTMADGTVHSCFVIDMSVSGIAISAELQPPLGTPLAVGSAVGRVVRLLPDGFAVEFVKTHKRQDLNRLISSPALLSRASTG